MMLMENEGDKKQEGKPLEPTSNWQFQNDAPSSAVSGFEAGMEPVKWEALEFIEHEKPKNWYFSLGVGGAGLAIIIYLLTRDAVSVFVVIVVAIIFGMAASRKPRQMEYMLDSSGIHIGPKHYPYEDFKTFSVVNEEGVPAVWLLPLKRFMPIIPIYYDPKDGDRIVRALSGVLPLENREPDVVDKLMHRLHF